MQNLVFMGVGLLGIAWVTYAVWFVSKYGGTRERSFQEIESVTVFTASSQGSITRKVLKCPPKI